MEMWSYEGLYVAYCSITLRVAEVHVESVKSEAMDDACSRNDTFPFDRGYEGLSGNTTSSDSNRKKLGSKFNSFSFFFFGVRKPPKKKVQ